MIQWLEERKIPVHKDNKHTAYHKFELLQNKVIIQLNKLCARMQFCITIK